MIIDWANEFAYVYPPDVGFALPLAGGKKKGRTFIETLLQIALFPTSLVDSLRLLEGISQSFAVDPSVAARLFGFEPMGQSYLLLPEGTDTLTGAEHLFFEEVAQDYVIVASSLDLGVFRAIGSQLILIGTEVGARGVGKDIGLLSGEFTGSGVDAARLLDVSSQVLLLPVSARDQILRTEALGLTFEVLPSEVSRLLGKEGPLTGLAFLPGAEKSLFLGTDPGSLVVVLSGAGKDALVFSEIPAQTVILTPEVFEGILRVESPSVAFSILTAEVSRFLGAETLEGVTLLSPNLTDILSALDAGDALILLLPDGIDERIIGFTAARGGGLSRMSGRDSASLVPGLTETRTSPRVVVVVPPRRRRTTKN